jgi:uncharacterized Fe-S center protein
MSEVYFFQSPLRVKDAMEKLSISGFSGKDVLVKLHFGEPGNKNHVTPTFTSHVASAVRDAGGRPFLFDTTVAYKSPRRDVKRHREVALNAGFTNEKTGCEVIISENGEMRESGGHEFTVADKFIDTECVVVLTHVKGHLATGFGGAIKNLGMGGVTKETKKNIHHWSKPQHMLDDCIFCGICAEVCPFDAITVGQGTWDIDKGECFGCGLCVENCKGGMKFWKLSLSEALAHSTKVVLEGKKSIYINVLKKISRHCDCASDGGYFLCPDKGYMVSDDPVAIDKASLDIVHSECPGIFEKSNYVDPVKHVKAAAKLGLGSMDYELIEL